MIGYFFRPECGKEDRVGPLIGPFPEFIQITYDWLRVGPDSDAVMERRPDGHWTLAAPTNPAGDWWHRSTGIKPSAWQVRWSDVTILARDVPDDALLTVDTTEATADWWVP
jgi:hypothetical protein